MAHYENSLVVEVAKGIKAFLTLRAGVTRGEVPDFDSPAGQQPEALRQTREQLAARTRQIDQMKERLANKDRRISQLEKRLDRVERSKNVLHDGVLLPPKTLRPCGPNFQNDEFYLGSARKEADWLAGRFGLSRESSLLDVGSGPGRLAIGITQRVGEIEKYRGVDVSEESVRWGQKHITPEHPNFQFIHIDVENRRYNPGGSGKDSGFGFPFADEEFDLITLYSVFTHMLTDGVRSYLKDFRRILKPEGRIYLTAFLEDDVPDVEENPQGYLGREWKGDLHCVRYNREFFEKLLDENGFRMDELDSGKGKEQGEVGLVKERGQSGVHLSKKSS